MLQLLTKNTERPERFTARKIQPPVPAEVMNVDSPDAQRPGEETRTEETDRHG